MTKEFFDRGKWIAKWADNNMTKDEALKMRIEQDEQWAKMINRKWQGLSDDEIAKIIGKGAFYEWNDVEFARAIEQALKEKNNAVQ